MKHFFATAGRLPVIGRSPGFSHSRNYDTADEEKEIHMEIPADTGAGGQRRRPRWYADVNKEIETIMEAYRRDATAED